MVRFGVRDYVEEEMRYERRVREKERSGRGYDEDMERMYEKRVREKERRFRDYDEEKWRYERRVREKERKLRDVENEDTRYAKEKRHRNYAKHNKEKEMGDISYEGYIRDFVLDPEYVKYLYENGHNKFARKVEKLALKEKEKLNEKKESKLERVFAKKVEEKKICINKEKMKIEEVTIKEELAQFIEVKENENQIVSLVKQESEVNEVLIVPPMDICKSTIELVLFQRESSLVCNEENIHKSRLILESWQKQSDFSLVTKINSRKVQLVLNVIFKKYHFPSTFKISYLRNEFVGLLKAKGGIVIHLFGIFNGFSLFPFDPGGYH
jgi:hypothetical protein